MPKDDVALHRPAPQVEVAVAQAQGLIGGLVVGHLEGEHPRRVQDRGALGMDFDLAGREVGVGHALGPALDYARCLEHVLGLEGLGNRMSLRRVAGVEHDLREAVAVAQVHEDEAAMVAPTVDPAGQYYRLTGIGCRHFAAGARSQHEPASHSPPNVPAIIGPSGQPNNSRAERSCSNANGLPHFLAGPYNRDRRARYSGLRHPRGAVHWEVKCEHPSGACWRPSL